LHGASTVPDLAGNGFSGTVGVGTGSAPVVAEHMPLGTVFCFSLMLGSSTAPSGTVCWGHDDSVDEASVRNLSSWSGTGSVSGSGNTEKIIVSTGQYMESPPWNLGSGDNARVSINKYLSADSPTVKYRTAATEAALTGGYSVYSVPFTSLGWVQVRIEG